MSETRIPSFCSDATACGCETHKYHGVPCTSVAQGRLPGMEYQRCLNCGRAWRAKEYAWEPTEEILFGREAA